MNTFEKVCFLVIILVVIFSVGYTSYAIGYVKGAGTYMEAFNDLNIAAGECLVGLSEMNVLYVNYVADDIKRMIVEINTSITNNYTLSFNETKEE